MMRLPPHGSRQRIGLFGGSFNPPHAGHVHVVMTALRRLQLDQVWILVSLGNPLKDAGLLAPYTERKAQVQRLISHPRVVIADLETQMSSRYSYDMIAQLRQQMPHVQLFWLMGADNLAHFHQWRHWRRIAALVPLAVVDRPLNHEAHGVMNSPAARYLARYRVQETQAASLTRAPHWVFLHGRRLPDASSMLRSSTSEPRISAPPR